VTLAIRLLGAPSVVQDGVPAPAPRGRKVWGLLTYLLITDLPPTRERLCDLLFADSDDPRRALRWNLTELRGLLGPGAELGGDPLVLTLPPDTVIDVRHLRSSPPVEALEHPGLGSELLAGLEPEAAPAFEVWLTAARRHEQATSCRILREAVETLLANGDTGGAVDAAGRLIALEPLDEEAHTLLVRSYIGSGDLVSARRQVAECTALFLRELDDTPGEGLTEALRVGLVGIGSPITVQAAIRERLEAGRSAMRAGLANAGLDAFRTALRTARAAGEEGLELAAASAVGSALVHLGRGAYPLGRQILTVVAADAERLDAPGHLTAARCELAWADMIQGRYRPADQHLRSARNSADDPGVCVQADVLTGWMLGDQSRYDTGLRLLEDARSAIDPTVMPGLAAWAGIATARIHLLRLEPDLATDAIGEACEIAAREGMRSFPATCAGSLALLQGNVHEAKRIFERAYAIAYQAKDATVLAASQRGLALIDLHRGEISTALEQLVRARASIVQAREYRWQAAQVLDALCGLSIAERLPKAGSWVDEFGRIADAIGADEFRARAQLYRYHLSGNGDALDEARTIAAGTDNRYLEYLVEGDANPIDVAST
jgi:DNA-binding SARP family transcriptional activator